MSADLIWHGLLQSVDDLLVQVDHAKTQSRSVAQAAALHVCHQLIWAIKGQLRRGLEDHHERAASRGSN